MSTLTSIEQVHFGATAARTVTCEARTDHDLLLATLDGDETAFAELVGRYRNQITNYIYRMIGDYDGAVDVAQETFIRVYKAAERYQTDYAFSTYLYRIATNLAISELRKRRRRRLVSLTGVFQDSESGEAEEFDPPDTRPLQDAVMVHAERQAAVARAITSLPPRYRLPLVLRDVEGKTYEEIATILSMREGTVKSRISRGRGLLREKLRAYL